MSETFIFLLNRHFTCSEKYTYSEARHTGLHKSMCSIDLMLKARIYMSYDNLDLTM